jgi:hypothetical protein
MRLFGGLVLAALMSGIASGLLLFGGIGVFITLPAAFVVAIVFGLPVYYLLRHLRWLSCWQFALAGVVGVSPFVFSFWSAAYPIVATLISGAVGGALFWWASVAPNKSVKWTAATGPR